MCRAPKCVIQDRGTPLLTSLSNVKKNSLKHKTAHIVVVRTFAVVMLDPRIYPCSSYCRNGRRGRYCTQVWICTPGGFDRQIQRVRIGPLHLKIETTVLFLVIQFLLAHNNWKCVCSYRYVSWK